MTNENEILDSYDNENMDYLNFDELEAKLQRDLNEQLSDIDFLREDRLKIGNPENVGNTVMSIVWEQFLNQMANTAGEDFIRENGGLTLDLRNDAHIQTTENFKNGKISLHNKKIDYQKRYDEWQKNFIKDENGNVKTKSDSRSKKEKEVLTEGARKPFDNGRLKGSASVHKDHTVPAAEIIRDSEANCHLSKEEQIKFANSEKNLRDMDSAANQSKGDSTMTEWLDSERPNGEKPADRFNIDEEKCRQDDKVAREEYEKTKKEGEKKSIESGKQSQKEEAFKITGKALRAVVMQLLAELIKEVIRKLIKWLQSTKKNIETLLSSIKSAISSFANNLKTHFVNAGNTLVNTITTAIFGPIVRTISKVFTMIKQGWKSLKEAIDYLKNPENKDKPAGILILEVGKIVIAGFSAVGALGLGEVIEKGLMTIPIFAFEIPLLGSLASLLGLFLGGLVSGILGAIAISLIDKAVENKLKNESIAKEIGKSNEILNTQNTIISLNEERLDQTKNNSACIISERHKEAFYIINNSISNILRDDDSGESDKKKVVLTGNEADFDDLLKNN